MALLIFISLNFLEIIWSINTEERMKIEDEFAWRGNISIYQCYLVLVKCITLEFNLGGINLSSLLLNEWVSLVYMFTSHYLLPINSNPLEYSLDGINPIFIFELMDFCYFRVHITSSRTSIYTPILQIPFDVTYFCYEHMY